MTPAKILIASLPLALLTGCEGELSAPVATVSSQGEAMRVAVALESLGASIREVREQRSLAYAIEVPIDDLPKARAILVAEGLPRDDREGLGVFSESTGIIPSELAERARLMKAMAEELENTLETIDGVVSARVHVVLPAKNPISKSDENPKPRAAVVIRTEADAAFADMTTSASWPSATDEATMTMQNVKGLEQGARALVGHSIPGIDPQDVSVTVTISSSKPAPTVSSSTSSGSRSPRDGLTGNEASPPEKGKETNPDADGWWQARWVLFAVVGGGGLGVLLATYTIMRRRSGGA